MKEVYTANIEPWKEALDFIGAQLIFCHSPRAGPTTKQLNKNKEILMVLREPHDFPEQDTRRFTSVC